MRLALLPLSLIAAALATPAQSQWQILPSPTSANLRGIHSLGNGIAWASGSNGAVLRTTDDGVHWAVCSTPPGAGKLDFRGIQAFDASTAIVMSSGKGDLSRLYKTTDACRTWTLLFTNPDPEGFWDSIQFADDHHGFLLGDPVLVSGAVEKRVVFKQTIDGGKTWTSWEPTVSDFAIGEHTAAFAASNSSMSIEDRFHAVVATGGEGGSAIGFPGNNEFPTDKAFCGEWCPPVTEKMATRELNVWWDLKLPFPKTESGGIFSIAINRVRTEAPNPIVAVGGDYKLPDSSAGTAAYGNDGLGSEFKAATTPPHGYRSAVAYDAPTQTWITVGPNGTDISTDDGRNWRALHPTPTEPPDADRNWNALSLPFVVGPHGHIGKLRPEALTQSGPAKP